MQANTWHMLCFERVHAAIFHALALFSAAACGGLFLNPSHASACSPEKDPVPSLSPVLASRPAGPFIFVLDCPNAVACREGVPPLRVTRTDMGEAEVAGTVAILRELAPSKRLVTFTPTSPLDPAAEYEMEFKDDSWYREVWTFRVVAPDDTPPLDHLSIEEDWTEHESGQRFECGYGAEHHEDECSNPWRSCRGPRSTRRSPR